MRRFSVVRYCREEGPDWILIGTMLNTKGLKTLLIRVATYERVESIDIFCFQPAVRIVGLLNSNGADFFVHLPGPAAADWGAIYWHGRSGVPAV